MRRPSIMRSTIIAVLWWAWAPVAAGATSYTAVDLGTLGGSSTYGLAINASGWVTGAAYSDLAVHGLAFLWNGSSLQNLGTLGGGGYSNGLAINASGWVTGWAYAGSGGYRAFLWNGSSLQDLGSLGGTYSRGLAINASGWVTGYAYTAGNAATHAFLWNGASLQDLGAFGGDYSNGSAINASGWVTGVAATAGNAAYHAFLWNGASLQDLGTLGGSDSYGTAINASGWVTGYAYTPGNAATHAFLWNGSSLQDLGTLGGTISQGLAINASGWVTGLAYTAGNAAHAFLWNGASMIDLNTFLPAGSPFVLESAFGINDAGQIGAVARNTATDEYHTFVLSPGPQFNFTGFFAPVDNPPVRNVLKAGQAVPVKFSLGGNQGLDIFASGYPSSQSVSCATLGNPEDIEQTMTAGVSGLQYDVATDQYTYAWKTDGTWANTCRRLTLKFKDGSQHVADFQFKK